MKSWFKTYWLLLVLPILYIVLISQYINGDISPNNHNLIITLTTIENWMNDGALAHNFNLINAWGNPGDLNVHYYPRVMSEEGRNYFVSYPPLSFIVFYGVVNIFNPSNLVIAFKLFGVFIHLISFWLVFYIVKDKCSLWSSYLLSGLFLFFPSSIVLSLMYYPEQLIIPLILLFIIILETSQSTVKNILLVLMSFLLVYCDWLGALLIASVVFFNIVIVRDRNFKEASLLIMGGLLGGGILLIQYSSINGFEALFHGLKLRYLERSGVFSETYSDRGVNLYSYNTLVYVYKHLIPTVIGAAIGLLFLGFKKCKVWKSKWFWLVVTPVLLHMILIFNSNILHFQNLAKLSIVFILGSVLWITRKSIEPIIVCSILSLNIFLSTFVISDYFRTYSVSSLIYEKAEFIKAQIKSDDVCILLQDGFSEDLVLLSYLTKRNLIWYANIDEAKISMKEQKDQSSFRWIDFENRKSGFCFEYNDLKK